MTGQTTPSASEQLRSPDGRGRLRRPPSTALAALGYVVVAILVTFSAWTDPMARWIGGVGDAEQSMSFLGWFPFAVTHGLNPLHISYIDLPTGLNAMWNTTMPFAALLIWPARALFGIVAAYNIMFVAALTLDGLCTFVWLRRRTRHQAAAFIGGLMLVVGPYALGQTYGHLNLVLFFALPLMFILLEDIVRQPTVRQLRRGFGLGVLGAVQLLCSEELLALGAVAFVIALAITALGARRTAVLQTAAHIAPVAIAAIIGFVVLAGGPLVYQLVGPGVLQAPPQAGDRYVTDLVNLVVPTQTVLLSPGSLGAGHPIPSWTGGLTEWDGYIGVPLLLVFSFAMVRWRAGWFRVVGWTTVVLVVLSLGPHLHVNGASSASVPMPEILIDRLPFLTSLLPSRFGLLVDFGLAAALATFVDRVGYRPQVHVRAMGWLAAGLVAATFWPASVPSSVVSVPRYFEAGGDVAQIPPATATLLFPLPDLPSASSTTAALWQAIPDFRFKMFSGAGISPTAAGAPGFGSPDLPLRCVTDSLQLTGSASGCSTTPPEFLVGLRALGIRLIIAGPTDHLREIAAYLTSLTGEQPHQDQGVLIWTV
ncbi:MAG: hypothetical protein M3019_05395 [Candidatus Dormibacteraeota bacterium]|nr:hypothetical protein [Candidatus Dormibacteraeota bacterium]